MRPFGRRRAAAEAGRKHATGLGDVLGTEPLQLMDRKLQVDRAVGVLGGKVGHAQTHGFRDLAQDQDDALPVPRSSSAR